MTLYPVNPFPPDLPCRRLKPPSLGDSRSTLNGCPGTTGPPTPPVESYSRQCGNFSLLFNYSGSTRSRRLWSSFNVLCSTPHNVLLTLPCSLEAPIRTIPLLQNSLSNMKTFLPHTSPFSSTPCLTLPHPRRRPFPLSAPRRHCLGRPGSPTRTWTFHRLGISFLGETLDAGMTRHPLQSVTSSGGRNC